MRGFPNPDGLRVGAHVHATNLGANAGQFLLTRHHMFLACLTLDDHNLVLRRVEVLD
jgi:hypothetical protein